MEDEAAGPATNPPCNNEASAGWTDRVDALLRDWRNRAYAAQTAYYKQAGRFRSANYALGIPVVIATTVVGTTIFADLDRDPRMLTRALSVLAAILAKLQAAQGRERAI